MACLEGLTYRSDVTRGLNENRQGLPTYSGSAAGLHEWKFKVLTKVKALEQIEDDQMRESKLVELASKVVDALCDEALKIAIDIGVDEVAAVGGITTLVAAIESHVSQFKDDEAQELFAIGSKADGELSRQRNESMVSYITRRKRWVIRLTDLDSNTRVSDNILASCLLDCARLSESEKLMIKTACGNRMNFEEIAATLRRQHPKIQDRGDRTQQTERRAFKPWQDGGASKPGGFPPRKPWKPAF